MTYYSDILKNIQAQGNFRTIPKDGSTGYVDFSTNDYMGLGEREDLRSEFFSDEHHRHIPMTSSASRLLASRQDEHFRLEDMMSQLYGRDILLFNSGYHANTGIISAIAGQGTFIVADRLSHASIIDGIVLSRAPFTRFRHNDYNHLESIIQKNAGRYERLLVITESVFSMEGDSCDIAVLASLKQKYPSVQLYIDEAHAFGVCGPKGLGLAKASPYYESVDIIVGTFGKAAASCGAFTAVSPVMKSFLINRSRSFIFSTALPPINSAWTRFIVEKLTAMDTERTKVGHLSSLLAEALDSTQPPSHITPLIIGDAARAVKLSENLLALGYKALPIRTPTVPAGTERLRFSISAAMDESDITGLKKVLSSL